MGGSGRSQSASPAPHRRGARLRLFVALELPGHIRASVATAIDPLRRQLPDLKWVRQENWHLTLKFLGKVEDEGLQPVIAVCRAAASEVSRGLVHLDGVSGLPSPARPRVIVISVVDDSGVAARLAGSLERGFSALGFPAETRAFKPHVTLARVRGPGHLNGPPEAEPPYDRSPFPVEEAVLFRSRPGPGGSVYEALERFPLA